MGNVDVARARIALLRRSSERLDPQVARLDEEALGRPSYCKDWTIAQVLSHLGSGSEIFAKFLDAAATGGALPGQDDFAPIWAAWDAKTPGAKAHDYAAANAAFLAAVEGLGDDALSAVSLDLWGKSRDAADLVGMRLNEHVVHSWDVLVMLDATAELMPEAVPSILDRLGELVGHVGKAGDRQLHVGISTSLPEQHLELRIGDGKVALGLADEELEARLELAAAALVRLVYGRLDAAHTPESVVATGVALDDLRAVFPGV